MSEGKVNKLGWFEAGIAVIVLLASLAGNYAAMRGTMAVTEERLSGLESRVTKNEEYDAYLTSQDDRLREQTIRNEEKIGTIEKNQEEFSASIKELAKEVRALREVLIELSVRSKESKDG